MMVRVMAVAGVCRVLSYYWEMIPAPVIKTLLGRLVKDLAWDASAINVRVAVLQVRQSLCVCEFVCMCVVVCAYMYMYKKLQHEN